LIICEVLENAFQLKFEICSLKVMLKFLPEPEEEPCEYKLDPLYQASELTFDVKYFALTETFPVINSYCYKKTV